MNIIRYKPWTNNEDLKTLDAVMADKITHITCDEDTDPPVVRIHLVSGRTVPSCSTMDELLSQLNGDVDLLAFA